MPHFENTTEQCGLNTASEALRSAQRELQRLTLNASVVPASKNVQTSDEVTYLGSDLWLARRELRKLEQAEEEAKQRKAFDEYMSKQFQKLSCDLETVRTALEVVEIQERDALIELRGSTIAAQNGREEQRRRNEERRRLIEEDLRHDAIMFELEIQRRTLEKSRMMLQLRKKKEADEAAERLVREEMAAAAHEEQRRVEMEVEYAFFKEFLKDDVM